MPDALDEHGLVRTASRLEYQARRVEAALIDALPFFIQWHVDDAEHPGRDAC